MKVLIVLLCCLLQQYAVYCQGQMDMSGMDMSTMTGMGMDIYMNMMSPTMEDDDHDDDHDDHGMRDMHDMHDMHMGDDKFIPHCDCVLSAPIDCADTDTLNSAMNVLLDSADDCLNKCDGLSICSTAFWTLHSYHESCPGSGGPDAGSLYHDFELSCTECFVELSAEQMMGRMCETVDCTNTANQNDLVAQLTNAPCLTDCTSDVSCQQAWNTLSAYHETCDEDNLSQDLTNVFHQIEEACPAGCIADMSRNVSKNCAAEVDVLQMVGDQGVQLWHTDDVPSLKVQATLDPRGMPHALVQVFSDDFSLTPSIGQDHSSGEGYVSYFVNGEQVARLYCPHAWVRNLKSGINNITVTAHSNLKQLYVHSNGEFSASTVLLVPENDEMDMGGMNMGGMQHMGGMDHDMDMMGGMDNMSDSDSHTHGTKIWGSGALPTVNLTATPDAVSGYNFQVTVDGFDFAPESVSGAHEEGMGHIHYMVDGEMAGMLFCDVFHLDLPAGEHTISVTLNSNTHATYVDENGTPLMDEITVDF